MPKISHNNIFQLTDTQYGLYVEDLFNELLRMERRRTERSKEPFILLLLELPTLNNRPKRTRVLHKVAAVLSSSTRETDVKGWYRQNESIGILFRNFGSSEDILDAGRQLWAKIAKNLSYSIAPEEMKLITPSYHIYPEEQRTGAVNLDSRLYSDVYNQRKAEQRISLLGKRAMDLMLTAILLFFSLPLIALVAVIIKLSSEGPVFYKQERVGFQGRKFKLFKFRSMFVDCNNDIHQKYIRKYIAGSQSHYSENNGSSEKVYKITDDPRITPIGKLLRKTSLDELPQLFNVLRGELSLVGPRPPLQYEWDLYDLWHKRRVTDVRPGVTGLWQVTGRSSTTFDEMVRLDLKYLKNWSLLLDLKILFQTPWAMLSCKGGY